MKTVIIYSSKTGYTYTYAKWLSDSLSADLFDIKDTQENTLLNYDRIIYGGGLYAGGINGLKSFKKLINIKDPRLKIIYATGVSPGRDEQINMILEHNFVEEELEYFKFFYLRGGFDISKLGIIDRSLMGLLKRKILHKKPEERTADDLGMLKVYDIPTDFTNKDTIKPILDYLNT